MHAGAVQVVHPWLGPRAEVPVTCRVVPSSAPVTPTLSFRRSRSRTRVATELGCRTAVRLMRSEPSLSSHLERMPPNITCGGMAMCIAIETLINQQDEIAAHTAPRTTA